MTPTEMDALQAAAEKATPGPWYHCQPFETVPAVRTIHGRVPAERVDYVSTWPHSGTPNGHRLLVPMPGRECRMRSEDMAFIAAANPQAILSLITLARRAEAAERELGEAREFAKEAAIAWEVCASIHREYAMKRDPFFTTRQTDFVRDAEKARAFLERNQHDEP